MVNPHPKEHATEGFDSSETVALPHPRPPKVENIPINDLPTLLREGIDLCADVTRWTRDKLDLPGTHELQAKANTVYELIQSIDVYNAESNRDYRAVAATGELRTMFAERKAAHRQRMLDEIARWQQHAQAVMAEHQRSLSEVVARYAQRVDNIRQKQSNNPEALAIAARNEALVNIFLGKNLNVYEDITAIYAAMETPEVQVVYQGIFHEIGVLRLFAAVNRKIQGTLAGVKQKTPEAIENEMRALRDFITKYSPEFFQTMHDLEMHVPSGAAPQEIASFQARALQWIDDAEPSRRATIVHEFVSAEEAATMQKQNKSGADYSDYLKIEVITTGDETTTRFDVTVNEMLGVATFAAQNLTPRFRLQDVLRHLAATADDMKVNGPAPTNDAMRTVWRDFGHVDGQYRQLQGRMDGLDKEEMKQFLTAVFALIQKEWGK